MSRAPSTRHQRVSRMQSIKIHEHLARSGSGEVFTAPLDIVGNHDILQPDLVVLLKEHAARLAEAGVDGPPDLVIEIVSPSTARMDRIRKGATYATFSVPEYWIFDPETESILAQTLTGRRYQRIASEDGVARSTHIPGLVIDPADIFTVPDWPASHSG